MVPAGTRMGVSRGHTTGNPLLVIGVLALGVETATPLSCSISVFALGVETAHVTTHTTYTKGLCCDHDAIPTKGP